MSKLLSKGMLSRPTKSSQAAFSRTDLIALIAMLSMFSLMAAPGAFRSRAVSRSLGCLENLRTLTRAWQMFDLDHGFLPANPDDVNTTPGSNWVPGQAGVKGAQEFNPDVLADPTRSVLFPYLGDKGTGVFHCPDDNRQGLYQGSDPAKIGTTVVAARSYSMSQAVGSNPYVQPAGTPVDGPWLDNMHNHRRYERFRTYGKIDDIIDPTPGNLAVLLDEDAYSLNDGGFAFGMEKEQWIDWPGTRHQMGAGLSFADGHAELRHWIDSRTAVQAGNVRIRDVPASEDYSWFRQKISARMPLLRPVAIVRPANVRPADVKAVWPGSAGVNYGAEFSDDLRSWQTLPTTVETRKIEVTVHAVDPSPAANGRRFYRLTEK
jgi:hypothetical protein